MDTEFAQNYEILNEEDKIKALIYRSWAEERRGNYKFSEKLGAEALAKAYAVDHAALRIGSYSALAFSQWRQFQSDKLVNYVTKGKEIVRRIGEENLSDMELFYYSYLLHAESLYFWEITDRTKAIGITKKAITYKTKIGDKFGHARLLGNLGTGYLSRGNLRLAKQKLEHAISILTDLKNKDSLALNYGNLSRVHLLQGNVAEAIDLAKNALILSQEVGNEDRTSSFYRDLVQILSDTEKFQEASYYLEELKEFSKDKINEKLSFDLRTAEGIFLINQSNLRAKVDGMRIFEQLIDEPSPPNRIMKSHFRIFICIVLIEELLLYGEDKTLEEIDYHLEKITQESKESPSIPYLETYILKSRLNLILGKLKEAEEKIDEGIKIAQDLQMTRLVDRMEEEKNKLHNNISQWQRNLSKYPSLKEKAQMVGIKKYFQKALKELHKTQ